MNLVGNAQITFQSSAETHIRCPHCGRTIILRHRESQIEGIGPLPNDDIGRLDLGEQKYSWIVCMNSRQSLTRKRIGAKESERRYCEYASDIVIGKDFKGV